MGVQSLGNGLSMVQKPKDSSASEKKNSPVGDKKNQSVGGSEKKNKESVGGSEKSGPKEPAKLEGLKKGDKKSVQEDKKLKEQVVSYTEYKDLKDFEDGFLYKTDQKKFLQDEMQMMTSDPENWFN